MPGKGACGQGGRGATARAHSSSWWTAFGYSQMRESAGMSTSSRRMSDKVLRSTVLPGSIVCSRTLSSMHELTNCEG